MRFRNLLVVAMSLGLLVIGSQVIFAQDDGGACDQLAQQVLDDLWMNCADPGEKDLEVNSVCYGHEALEALFEGDQGVLDDPGDWAELTWLARLGGSPFDLAESEWGLGLFHVQAYVEGKKDKGRLATVKYLTMGEVEIEQADAPAFDKHDDLIIDADHLAPMQRAYLRTGWSTTGCEEIPAPLLLVQYSPDEKGNQDDKNQGEDENGDQDGDDKDKDKDKVKKGEEPARITINSAEIELEPDTTILLKNLQPMFGLDNLAAQTMRLITLNGMAIVDPDGEQLLVPPGHYVDFCLAEPQNLGMDGEENDQVISCDPSDPQPLTALDLVQLLLLEQIPDNILETIDVPGLGQRSGLGGPEIFFIFDDPSVLDAAREACSEGLLPEQICRRLQLTYVAGEVCEQFARQVVRVALWETCSDFAEDEAQTDNNICYGHWSLSAVFEGDQGTLSAPGDYAELTWLNRLSGAPFNPTTDEWGIGLLHVQAYVGGEVELARVKYLTLGNVEIEQVDAPAFDENGQLIIDADHLAPMQRMYFRNGWNDLDCEGVPSPLLLAQSPLGSDQPVRIMVNSLEIEFESTVALKNVQPLYDANNMAAQTMRVISLDGQTVIDPDGLQVTVPAGYYVDVCLDAPANLGVDGQENDQVVSCEPTEPQPLADFDLTQLDLIDQIPNTIFDFAGVPGFE